MRIDFRTDVGSVRKSNQDACSCGLFEPGGAWAVVCDGMGGVNGGSVASSVALESLEKTLKEACRGEMPPDAVESLIQTALSDANLAVYNTAKKQIELRGMGTTGVVMVASNGLLHVAHVGDSRAYIMNSSGLSQITVDHSYVQNLVNMGEITPQEARVHPQRNIITRVLGVYEQVKSDYSRLEFNEGDLALACSDGLTNYMDEETMTEYIEKYRGDPGRLCDELIAYAVNMGGADNITVAVIDNTGSQKSMKG